MAAEQKDDPKVSPVAEDPIQPQLCLYYFIGRLNPPHEGHILALAEMLNAVKEQQKRGNRAKALILLGNGPRNKTKGFGSSDNPIHFDLKERIVRAQLTKMFKDDIDDLCEIKEMRHSFGDTSLFVSSQILDHGKDCSDVQIIQYAGNKDEDSTKLSGALLACRESAISMMSYLALEEPINPTLEEYLEEHDVPEDIPKPNVIIFLHSHPAKSKQTIYDWTRNYQMPNILPVIIGVCPVESQKSSQVGVPSTESMSATQRRESVYNDTYTNKQGWVSNFVGFYGSLAEELYDAINAYRKEYEQGIASQLAKTKRKRVQEEVKAKTPPPRSRRKRDPVDGKGESLAVAFDSPGGGKRTKKYKSSKLKSLRILHKRF